MSLPIRRLPILVIHLVLQTMGFLDLFLLTRTSTKMKRIVQNMQRIEKYNLIVTVEKCLVIQIQSKTNLCNTEQINVQLEENKPNPQFVFNMGIASVDRLPSAFQHFEDGSLSVNTYWTDTKAGCVALCNELVDVFKTSVYGVILELDEVENYQNEINWVNLTFPALIIFHINGKCSFQDYMWMIRNSRATEALKFDMEPTDYPENKNEIVPLNFEGFEEVLIEHGKWVGLKQLQAFKSNFIGIKDVEITDSEFNEFLRNLKNSKEKPMFEELIIYFPGEADLDVVLEGLFSEEEGASKLEDIGHGFVFKTGNGQKCTIVAVQVVSDEDDEQEVGIFGFEINIED